MDGEKPEYRNASMDILRNSDPHSVDTWKYISSDILILYYMKTFLLN